MTWPSEPPVGQRTLADLNWRAVDPKHGVRYSDGFYLKIQRRKRGEIPLFSVRERDSITATTLANSSGGFGLTG